MTRLGPTIVAALVLVLAATIGWELTEFSVSLPTAVVHPRPLNQAARPAVLPDRTPDLVATILARPLFSPDRRPAAGAAGVLAGGAPAGLPRLAGVLVTPSGRRAIFAAEGDKPLVLTEGGTIAAWTVRAIAAGEVRLSGTDGIRVLHPTFRQQPSAVTSDPASARRAGQFSSSR